MQKHFIDKIAKFICDRRLLDSGDKCLVALSGGADSVALLITLQHLGYDIEAVHCNFHLRGEESDRDEMFCTKLCKERDITLHKVHFDTHTYATLHKVSIEMAARELRYDYFRKLAKDIDATAICVAHHRDDSVETVLMNLIRGTGVHGLKGIAPKNGNIVRPLLCVSREEIISLLNSLRQNYVTDSSNLVDDVRRNKIRLNIIPLIKQINPSAQEAIAHTALLMESVAKIYDETIQKYVSQVVDYDSEHDCVTVDIPRLKAIDYRSDIVFNIVKDYGFSSSQAEIINNAVDSESGRMFYSNSHRLLIDRSRILIEPCVEESPKTIKIPEEGTYVFNEKLKFRVSILELSDAVTIDKRACCMSADIEKIKFPLVVRHTVRGDRFVPFGMKGSKLVSDFLTDRKATVFDKQRQLVVTDSDNNIIWLVGLRPDNRYRITSKTKKILKIEFEG